MNTFLAVLTHGSISSRDREPTRKKGLTLETPVKMAMH